MDVRLRQHFREATPHSGNRSVITRLYNRHHRDRSRDRVEAIHRDIDTLANELEGLCHALFKLPSRSSPSRSRKRLAILNRAGKRKRRDATRGSAGLLDLSPLGIEATGAFQNSMDDEILEGVPRTSRAAAQSMRTPTRKLDYIEARGFFATSFSSF